MKALSIALCSFWLAASGALLGQGPPTGFQAEVRINRPTRLDSEFVTTFLGTDTPKVRSDYDSMRQRYQLYVPRSYVATKEWPLLVFISPGDAPSGWRSWQSICEQRQMIFCAAYAAGNSCPPQERIRIVLDMLDQVRRDYRIDAERTYISGFSGGGRIACIIAYQLPEYFGGVIPICGSTSILGLDYLRHRVQDRLSFALVTGEKDFNRSETENLLAPLLSEIKTRVRLWIIPQIGHTIPEPKILDQATQWIEEDLERRRQDVKQWPTLACPPETSMVPVKLAGRHLEAAEKALEQDETMWRGAALLHGVIQRWGRTEPGVRAQKRLDALRRIPAQLVLAEKQKQQETALLLPAQARGFERLGDLRNARTSWKSLVDAQPMTEEAKKAQAEIARLTEIIRSTPVLGVTLAGQTNVVQQLTRDGPAEKAGVQLGDRLRVVNGEQIRSSADLQLALKSVKPGATVKIALERRGKIISLDVKVGALGQ